MNFGQAIDLIKNGQAVARFGWTDEKASLVLRKGSIDYEYYGCTPDTKLKYPHGSTLNGVDFGLFEMGDKGTIARLPNIRLLTDGLNVDGWTPSQADMLAEDWIIVPEK